MTAVTFDTHKLISRLRKANFNEEQAEIVSEALQEVLEVNMKELATKGDITSVKQDIRELELKFDAKIAETKAELIRWVVAVGFLQTTLVVGVLLKVARLA